MNRLKIKGLTRRWLLNCFGAILVIVILAEVAISFFIHSYYYDMVRSEIERKTETTVTGISSGNPESYSNFETLAIKSMESFDDRTLFEMMVIDEQGNVKFMSSGFNPPHESMKDYENARQSGKLECWEGRLSTGEKVMSACQVVYGRSSNTDVGAVRFIVSLTETDRHIIKMIAIVSLISIVLLTFVVYTGFYFINSIVKPVAQVNETARTIASGNFDARVSKRYTDEIGELGDTINYMAGELAANEKMKNDFISSVSHELRTPLTAIKGWGETIKAVGPSDKAVFNKGMGVIVKEAERLSGLVDELLDFSRLGSGRLTLHLNKLDIVAELEEIMFIFMERSNRDRIIFSYNVPDEAIIIVGDTDRLRQVFTNLLDNAFKYCNENGHVNAEVKRIDNEVHIIISDDGVGISKEDLPRVREKFYKADQTRRGSGIGLNIADEIIKLHNGKLLLDSELGIGTTATVILPVG
ncbi:MAG: HAMP domain-containing protein [Clostridia bacterium]|nr:HAMP domain-containing protein [Clostridia bacterium]